MKERTNPKVSIMIPCYNNSRTIEKAIISALEQTYARKEIVVSDDCSTDNSPDIINKFLKHETVKFFRNKKNLGRVKNYQKLLYEYASGDYVLNLDGDDFLTDTDYIRKAIQLIIRWNVVMVFAKQRVCLEKKNRIFTDKINENLPEIIDGNWLFLNYYKGYSIPHLTTIYNRQMAIKAGFYQKDILSTDWESFFRIMIGNKIGFINSFAGVWRRHENNCTKKDDPVSKAENIEYITSGYKLAKEKNIAPEIILEKWKLEMLKRYFVKHVIRFQLLEEYQKKKQLLDFIGKHYPKVYKYLKSDIRLKLFFLFSGNKAIVKFVFKRMLKMEWFYEEIKESSSRF